MMLRGNAQFFPRKSHVKKMYIVDCKTLLLSVGWAPLLVNLILVLAISDSNSRFLSAHSGGHFSCDVDGLQVCNT